MAPRHALTIAQDTLGAGKIRCITDRPILHPTEAQQNRSTQLCRQHGLGAKQFAVLLPGCQAAGYLKRWGTQRYAALADRLLREGHVEKVALLGGPDEMDDCSAIAARATIDGVVNLCGQTELLEVTAICRSASVVVGNDTGTGHLASAGDTPLIIICGPTDPRRVKPAGPQVHTMQADLPCINCYRKHCAHHSCMHLLTPTVVADVVVQRLRSNGSAEVL
ncbi:MAG: glycosyltransferase family 9 protein [Chromatiales bacterium]|nr:glycosyltransferase family 9 protein [Chromatiales bacterium]